MFSSASWSLSSATSAPSSSSSACWLAGVCSCLLLFQQTCHWHHSYKWCLMKFCLRIHHTVSRRHLNPHCLVHLPHQAALEHVGLLHGEIYFFPIMLHQTVLPECILFIFQPEGSSMLLPSGVTVASSLSIVPACFTCLEAGFTTNPIPHTALLALARA